MAFLHPWAIVVGLAAVALPLAIHWLTRPRPTRLPLSTLRFVREALRQRRARHRLRDAIILALRCAAVLLLAGAIARPLAEDRPLVTPGEAVRGTRVVIVDVSHSMAAAPSGVQLLERARALAAAYLADQPGLRANLLLAGASPHPAFDGLSTNFPALRQELAQARVRPERLNVQAALNLASELLARAGTEEGIRRELVVLSDFQRSSWSSADFSPLPADTRIQLDTVAPAEAPANLAILRVGSQGRAEEGREVRLEVEVGNYGPAARRVRVELALEQATYHLEGLCPPGSTTTLTAEAVLRDTGWQTGAARLLDAQDVLPGDNVHPFALEIRPAPSYALLTRQSAEQRPSSSYYLECAFAPARKADGRLLRLNPAAVDAEVLRQADLLILDHPGRLPAAVVRQLAALLRRGRGLLYVAAEAEDATNLQLLVEAAGAELQLPVDLAPAPATQRRRNLFLAEVKRNQAPFHVFGEQLPGLIGSLRFAGGLASRRRDAGLADDILASYGDGSACLVVTTCGAGNLAILNSDLAASNLPASAAFVPLLGELAGRLLGQQRAGSAFTCGEPTALYLPAAAGSASGLLTQGPDGTDEGTLTEGSGGVLWRCPEAARPGVYRVRRGERVVFAAAAVLPAEESDLRPLEPQVLQARLAGARRVHVRAAASAGEAGDDLWTWLAIACVGCLLAEVLALRLFRT